MIGIAHRLSSAAGALGAKLPAKLQRGLFGKAGALGRTIALFGLMLVLLGGGILATAQITTNRLLFSQATSEADNWADYLAGRLPDMEAIAEGQVPSAESMAFLEQTGMTGEVFRYEIFNRAGYSQLVSDHGVVSLVDLSAFSAGAARSIATGMPQVDVQQGNGSDLPDFYARAYVPVLADGSPIAVVSAFVDQTAERIRFYESSLTEGILLCLLSGLCFSVPVIAWYRRTREKQRADQQISYLAHHDSLTGLFNRSSFVNALEREFNRLPAADSGFAVHMIDIDRFKEVNDTFGHDGGDRLLQTIAERLLATTRTGDMLARLGGDEFVAIQPQVRTLAEVDQFARRLSDALTPTIHFNQQEIRASVSIGAAWAPADGDSPQRILKSADLALYEAKADGRNCVRFFRAEMDAALVARIHLEKAIRAAIADDHFEVYYQPIFDIGSRRLIGFEALVRLPAEDGSLIPPTTFIPVAEELRLIDKVGAWVLRAACTAAASWPEHLTVAVNLSPGQFAAGSVSETVAAILHTTGLSASRLELEITEGLLLENSDAIMAELHKLKALGVAIVMDDFGTGYSSLGYLWRFPFDKLKIDRSFMEGFDGTGRDARTVVKTIVALGEELKVNVTVEGVETEKQMAFLDSINGQQAQGFYLGRPMPLDAVAPWILAEFQRSLGHPENAGSSTARPMVAGGGG